MQPMMPKHHQDGIMAIAMVPGKGRRHRDGTSDSFSELPILLMFAIFFKMVGVWAINSTNAACVVVLLWLWFFSALSQEGLLKLRR